MIAVGLRLKPCDAEFQGGGSKKTRMTTEDMEEASGRRN